MNNSNHKNSDPWESLYLTEFVSLSYSETNNNVLEIIGELFKLTNYSIKIKIFEQIHRITLNNKYENPMILLTLRYIKYFSI